VGELCDEADAAAYAEVRTSGVYASGCTYAVPHGDPRGRCYGKDVFASGSVCEGKGTKADAVLGGSGAF